MPRLKAGLQAVKQHSHPGTTLEELTPILSSATEDLRVVAVKAFKDASDWLDSVNHSRWRQQRDAVPITTRESNIANLRSTLGEFRETKHFDLLEPFREAFDSAGNVKSEYMPMIQYSARDLFKCHVFTTNLIAFSLSLVDFLSFLLEVERANPKPRIQLPSAFTKKLMESANQQGASTNPLDLGANQTESSERSSTDTRVEKGKGDNSEKAKPARSYGEAYCVLIVWLKLS